MTVLVAHFGFSVPLTTFFLGTAAFAAVPFAAFTGYLSYFWVQDALRKRHIARAPGSFWVNLLTFLLPRKVYADHFGQTIADMRDECAALDFEGRKWQRRWISLVYHGRIVLTLCLLIVVGVLKKISKIWSAI
ncbi:MAG: hypothetical protein AAGK37_04935 [Pseudomonadota bacterium]